jgi:hypothetical protein
VFEVGERLAVSRKPAGTSGKGMYELKEECFVEYSPYYYHYSRTEQAKVAQCMPFKAMQIDKARY